MLPILRYKTKAKCGKLTTEYYADRYSDAKHIVQNTLLSHCWFHVLPAKFPFMRASPLKVDYCLL